MASRNARKDWVELFVVENRFFFFIFVKDDKLNSFGFSVNCNTASWQAIDVFSAFEILFEGRAFRLSIPLKDGLRTADNKG